MPVMRNPFAVIGIVLFGLLSAVTPSIATAEIRLPGFYGDHMVLQQGMKQNLWGWAAPGEKVNVQLGNHSADAVTTELGQWRVELPALESSSAPIKFVVSGSNRIELADVLVGEVWLCSGQSNMEWTVASSTDAKAEIAAADYPLIRHLKVGRAPSPTPIDDIKADWQVCTPDTAGRFTAAGYFMARELVSELNVPVGLLNSSWGGTRVEPWTPPAGFASVPALSDITASVLGRTPGSESYDTTLQSHLEATKKWLGIAEAALDSGETLKPSPVYPAQLAPFTSHQDPTMLYNGMIHALVGFPIRGAIWYQGESNHAEGMLYTEKKKALIGGWRQLWGQGDFPFYFVQIAPYKYGTEDPAILARFWEAQQAVTKIPNTGMVVINDIATLNNIHPPNKQDVGQRLALLALKNDYGRSDVVAESPTVVAVEPAGKQLIVTFENTGKGLKSRDGSAPTHFEIIDAKSGGFQPADAKIDGDRVILSAESVSGPVAFRFAWHKLAEPNLCGSTGLPVGACRGGKVPEFVNTLPIDAEYKLACELDFTSLGNDVRYSTDHRDAIASFDRIAYLMELQSPGGPNQVVFVSMDAFTDDVHKIAVPTASSGAHFQQIVKSMDVLSNVPTVVNGVGIETGNLEFWSSNYGQANSSGTPNASGSKYDFGDSPSGDAAGYGSMQVHNHAARQTVFALNHWSDGKTADIGIGNSEGANLDWTFTSNAASYSQKRLRVYVRPVASER